MTDGGTAQTHTAREHVGSLSSKHWTLRRILAEFRKGEDSQKPPQEGGLQGGSHAAEAAPTKRIRCYTSRSDEGLGGTSIEERHASVRRNGVPSAMYCNFGSERNVAERHSTPDEAGAVF